jgi:farnesyl-diphosphate farnesyltransferase
LKAVSRSFYLTLSVVPAGMRDPVGVGYLLACMADTIADTSVIEPAQRLALLLELRAQVRGESDDPAFARRLAIEVAAHQSKERRLLESIGAALQVLANLDESDRNATRDIVTKLTTGMERDLRTFPDERSGRVVALAEFDELDHYTYLVAGCVGEFWTKMTYAHVPGALIGDPAQAIERAVRFGKALQLTNVLRDCAKDLRIGRCYLPVSMLSRYGLAPEDLLSPDASARARPVMFALVGVALDHYRAAIDYTLSISAWSPRLRLASLWPIFIGLGTFLLLVDNDEWLDPQKVSKVRRGEVYRIIARSVAMVASDRLLRSWAEGLIDKIEARIAERGHAVDRD